MLDKKSRLSRLGAKLVGMSVLGLVLAFAVFYLLDGVVTPWLLYSERFAPFWLRRNAALIQTYQDYVTENDLTVQQVVDDREGRLQAMGEGIYTIVVGTPSVVEFPVKAMEPSGLPDDASYHFSYSTAVGFTSSAPANDSVEFLAELHQIQCADGVLFVSNSPMVQRYEGVGRLTGLLLALLIFCAVMIPGIVRLVRRIGALSREAGFLMAGDLDHAIRVKGRDELSALGEDIERLRLSVLARLEGEREAVGANARLITSLSHDIRTPLTKLTGYLDILTYEKYQGQEEHDEYLRLSSEKAAQLKALTDQLFTSAQVAAPASGLEQPPEAVDGGALLGQLLTEQCDDLRREGFTIQPPVFDRKFTLCLRTEDAVRVFDNLYSNFRKYADPASPIEITWRDAPERVTLRFRSRALPAPDRADSHGLGVPTMRELMERSGGALEVSLEGEIYQSTLTFRRYQSGRV